MRGQIDVLKIRGIYRDSMGLIYERNDEITIELEKGTSMRQLILRTNDVTKCFDT
jgi:hypothetical protein